MAQRLQREHSLPVVAVRLTQDASGPQVQVDLVVNEDGQQALHGSRAVPLKAFGSRTARDDPLLQVPEELVRYADDWAREVLEPGRVLWLHLVKPYGTLGAVPWERDLVPTLGRPLLRLPDVLPAATGSTTSIAVALIATAPAPEGPPPALMLGMPVARALDKALQGRMHLHVFADAGTEQVMTDNLRSAGFSRFEVHSPADYRARADGRTTAGSDLRSGWLRWVRDVLTGRTVDIVHFLVHGNSLGTRGAILTPLEATEDRAIPVSVEAAEVESLLTQVGALVAGFSRLSDNWSDFGLRLVTDELGARRSGPVLLHDSGLDDEFFALEAAYRFLIDPQPGMPPSSASLQVHAQPRQVAQEARQLPPQGKDVGPEPSAAVQAHFERDETPGWLSAAQRYLEQQEVQLLRFRSETERRTPSPTEVARYAGIESALKKAHAVIDRHAERLL